MSVLEVIGRQFGRVDIDSFNILYKTCEISHGVLCPGIDSIPTQGQFVSRAPTQGHFVSRASPKERAQ
jgi:hypothetical protein